MTLPEHIICSAMLAQFGVRRRYGWKGVWLVVAAGIGPDADSAAKLVADQTFWKMHHALGHNLFAVAVIAGVCAGAGRGLWGMKPFGRLFCWCLLAAVLHCLTDSLYWWGIYPLWPVAGFELKFDLLEYLDLIVLSIWLAGAVLLWRARGRHDRRIASVTLGAFALYVAARAVLPEPTGWLKLITGGWIYAPPHGTPVLDWWNWR